MKKLLLMLAALLVVTSVLCACNTEKNDADTDEKKEDQNKEDENKEDENKEDENKEDENKEDENKEDKEKEDGNPDVYERIIGTWRMVSAEVEGDFNTVSDEFREYCRFYESDGKCFVEWYFPQEKKTSPREVTLWDSPIADYETTYTFDASGFYFGLEHVFVSLDKEGKMIVDRDGHYGDGTTFASTCIFEKDDTTDFEKLK